MRIAIGGMRHETNTFSPLFTEYGHFAIYGEKAVFDRVEGQRWQSQGVELIPCMIAEALPGGLVRRSAYQRLKTELLQALKEALPVDGVYLDLHGAMEVEEIGDAEGDLAFEVRSLVGPETPISVSLDLHGNISPALVENVELLTAFRTAPHRDEEQTRQRALGLLFRSVRENLAPKPVLIKIPLLLSGEQAVTDVEPARTLYARLSEIATIPGILDASLLVGCAWTDSPFTSVSVIVVAERDRQLAEHQARAFAGEVWARRHEYQFHVETLPVDEAIRMAMEAGERPVFLTDSGDNVTAGAPGDVPFILERLLALNAKEVLVAGIADAEAVEQCEAGGVGAVADLSLGGKLDPAFQPLKVRGGVLDLAAAPGDQGGHPVTAVVGVEGVCAILTRERRPFIDLEGFLKAHVDPRQYKIIVVKQGYLSHELNQLAGRSIMALSPGATDLRLVKLAYRNIIRPAYPLDINTEFLAWNF